MVPLIWAGSRLVVVCGSLLVRRLPPRLRCRFRPDELRPEADSCRLRAGEAGLLSGTEDLTLRLLQIAGALAILLLPLVVIAAATAVHRKGLRGLWPVLVGLACLAFAWFAVGFHLLGPSLAY